MFIFGNEVTAFTHPKNKLYNLQELCRALDLSFESCLDEIKSNPDLTVVELINDYYIDAITIARWLVVPGIGKIRSHTAIQFTAVLCNKLINHQDNLMEKLVEECSLE